MRAGVGLELAKLIVLMVSVLAALLRATGLNWCRDQSDAGGAREQISQ